MVISVIAYGYMLGSIAAGLTNTATLYSAFKEKISAVKVFLKVRRNFQNDSCFFFTHNSG